MANQACDLCSSASCTLNKKQAWNAVNRLGPCYYFYFYEEPWSFNCAHRSMWWPVWMNFDFMFNILQSLVSSSYDLTAASDKTNKTFYLAPSSQVKPPSSWETCVLLQKTCLIGLIHIVFSLINTRFLWRSTQILGSLNPFRVSPLCSSLNHPPSFLHILFPTLRLSSSPSSSHAIASTPFISLWPPLPPIFLIVIPNYHTLSAWHTIMCHITSCIWIKHTAFKHYHPPISPPKANLFSMCNGGFYTNLLWKELCIQLHRHLSLWRSSVQSAQSFICTGCEDARRDNVRLLWDETRTVIGYHLDWLVNWDISELREVVPVVER